MSKKKVKAAEICPSCGGGRLWPQESREELLGIDLGTYPSLVCDTCGESYLDGDAMARLEARARELGIWGSSELRFKKLSARFRAEARRRGLTKRQLLQALENIRRENA